MTYSDQHVMYDDLSEEDNYSSENTLELDEL